MSTHSPHEADSAAFDGLIIGEDLPIDLVRRMARSRRYLIGTGDAEYLIRLVLCSNSLTPEQKTAVLDAMPTLSQFQIDELTNNFEYERRAFSNLRVTEYGVIANLQARSLQESMHLVAEACQVRAPLVNAWTRRTVRRANTRGLWVWMRQITDCEWTERYDLMLRPDPCDPWARTGQSQVPT